MSRLNLFLVLMLSFSLFGHSTRAEESNSKSPSLEQSLRKRVTAFYVAVRAGRWDQAAQFVAAKAREAYKQNSEKILSFEIVNVTLDDANNSAVVEVSSQMIIKSIGKAGVVSRTTRWLREEGDWYFDPTEAPRTLADVFQEYYVDKQKMRVGKNKAAASPQSVKFEKEIVNFGVVVKGKVLDLRFPLKNLSTSEIRLEKVYLQQEFMKDVTSKRTLKPGETGEVVVQLDTSPLYREVDQTIFVQLEPVKEMVRLRVVGKVFEAKDLEAYTPPK